MQKLWLGLPIALTVVACGQMNRPTAAATPKDAALTYESEGALSYVATPSGAPSSRPLERTAASSVNPSGAPGRNPSTIGDFVRTRSAQMNFCYEEALVANPKLAGAIAVAVTITSAGDVTDASVTKRSWSGKGSEVLEQCVRARVRTWKFPASEAPTGTYPFSLSFTK